jgi:alpha-galactosidase
MLREHFSFQQPAETTVNAPKNPGMNGDGFESKAGCSKTMSQKYLSSQQLGDIIVRFPKDPNSNCVGLELFPADAVNLVVPRRQSLRGLAYIDSMPGDDPFPAYVIESLVQFKLAGEPYSHSFIQGHSMRQSKSVEQFFSAHQETHEENGQTLITTRLQRADGCSVKHYLTHSQGEASFRVYSSFTNDSNKPVTLEMLSSFSLSGITPFAPDDAPRRLRVHRFRSGWSAEGRLESQTLESLHLERSWSGTGTFSERFGQVGSMPVRRWFPFAALEDTVAGVFWGVQLAWAGSWQIEIFRRNDDISLSGGLADREFGHWTKTLQPGETFTSPVAVITCVRGSFDELCERLTSMHVPEADKHPLIEHDLPIIFNEWCTTWGNPSHEKLCAIADRLNGSRVRYLVIDAGWYKSGTSDWCNGHGDWNPSPNLFPDGLESTASAIQKRGLIPGLWFEMETVGSHSTAFSLTDHLLKRDGVPLTVRDRRFWDLNDPWVVDFLTQKVIGLLERCHFGYLKVDYNETLGIGCDNPDSLGEGLRRQIEGQYRLFDKIRSRLPNLVIENCSSGGHRLEPSMVDRTAMTSFSDAHELPEIPIIAANLHRLILPRQLQVWAVLHPTDSDERLIYSLAATFLGRMCLSGEISELKPLQWALVEKAMSLYQFAAPVIKQGHSQFFGVLGESWRHPEGWQTVVRTSVDRRHALVVLHTFRNAPANVEVCLPVGTWMVVDSLDSVASCPPRFIGTKMALQTRADFTGAIHLLRRR